MVSTPAPDPIPPGDYVPTADQRIVMRGLDWAGFQTLLALRGERPIPRMAYLDGVVELMGPSRGHEGTRSNLGRLVEAYCLERGVPISPYGSWHLEDETDEAGGEPDECYVFGADPRAKNWPDLVIEVIWTSGGINKLEIYRRLGIAEVWFWKDDRISVHVLGPNGYTPAARSACLPELDLQLVCTLLVVEPLNDAVKQFLEALHQT